MKTAATVLLIVVMCIQYELSSGYYQPKWADRIQKEAEEHANRLENEARRLEEKYERNYSRIKPTKSKVKISSSEDDNVVNDYPGKTIIKGQKGVIKVDGKVKVKNDKKFKNGFLKVSISGGCIKINGRTILKREHSPVSNGVYQTGTTNFNNSGVNSFEIKVLKNGQVMYTDDGLDPGEIMYAQL